MHNVKLDGWSVETRGNAVILTAVLGEIPELPPAALATFHAGPNDVLRPRPDVAAGARAPPRAPCPTRPQGV